MMQLKIPTAWREARCIHSWSRNREGIHVYWTPTAGLLQTIHTCLISFNPHYKPRRTPLNRHVDRFGIRPGLPQYHTVHETSKIWTQFLGPQKLSSYPCVVLSLRPQWGSITQSQIHFGDGGVVMGSSSSLWWRMNPSLPWPLPANKSFPFPSKLYPPAVSWDCDCPSPQERYPSTRAKPWDGQHPTEHRRRDPVCWAPAPPSLRPGRLAPSTGSPWGCWGAHPSHPW